MRKPTVQIAPWVFPLTEETASVPRMCWEKLSAVFTSCINLGSPPRVRGKDAVCTVGDAGCRITPACAGKRAIQGARAAGTEDHPRVCGEKVARLSAMLMPVGSPPRVRGKVQVCSGVVSEQRITPACAGKRFLESVHNRQKEDHPRVCGEKCFSRLAPLPAEGSPPRVRGKEFTTASSTIVLWDHPRVCGEKAVLPMWTNTRLGSPPRVRGKAFSYSARSRAVGITPACAGKRPPDFPSRPPAGDHPRVCGEKVSSAALMMIVAGSPPRVRGKAVAAYNSVAAEGITPACAGKSTLRKTAGSTYRDHPRVCGEKTKESLKK